MPRKVFDARLVAAAVARRRGAAPAHRAGRCGSRPTASCSTTRSRAGGDRRRRRGLGGPAGARATRPTRTGTWRWPSAATPRPARARPSSASSPRRPRWPAYAWAFPIGDGRANVGYGEVLRGRAAEPGAPAGPAGRAAARASTWPTATGLRAHHLPLSTRRPPPGAGPVLLAGDALSLINPFTGEGIFYAVLSGCAGRGGGGRGRAGARGPALRRRAAPAAGPPPAAQRRGGVAGPRAGGGGRGGPGGRPRPTGCSTTMVELGLGDGLLHRPHAGPDRPRVGPFGQRQGSDAVDPGGGSLRLQVMTLRDLVYSVYERRLTREARRQAGAPPRRGDVRRQPPVGQGDGLRRSQRRAPGRRGEDQACARLV